MGIQSKNNKHQKSDKDGPGLPRRLRLSVFAQLTNLVVVFLLIFNDDTGMKDYPEKLVSYLSEQMIEENEIIITQNDDGQVLFIPQRSLNGWIIIIEWGIGADDFQVVNIYGAAATRLRKLMDEENMN